MPRTPATLHHRRSHSRTENGPCGNQPAGATPRGKGASDSRKPKRGRNTGQSDNTRVGVLFHVAGGDGAADSRAESPAEGTQDPMAPTQNKGPAQGWRRDQENQNCCAHEESWTLDLGAVRACVFTEVSAPRRWRGKVIGSGFYATLLARDYSTRASAMAAVEDAAGEVLQAALLRLGIAMTQRR